MQNKPSTRTDSSGQTDQEAERRDRTRAPLAARVEILEHGRSAAISGRISDLSLGGCYADVINTFAVGTRVHVRITHKQQHLIFSGEVRFEHPGLGMGIGFQSVTPQQLEILNSWLRPQESSADEPAFGEQQPGGAQSVASLPENRLEALIEILTRKGILSAGEKLDLLNRP